MNFSRKDEKWQGMRGGASLDGSGEAESLNEWRQDPADEIDQSTLAESGIVFAESVSIIGIDV